MAALATLIGKRVAPADLQRFCADAMVRCGLSPEEARQRFPSEFEAWQKNPWSVRMPGGETLSAVKERSVPALEEIARQAGGTVAVISHDVVNRVLLTHVLQMPPSGFGRIRQEPACLNVLVNDAGTWQVIRLNDRCHLD